MIYQKIIIRILLLLMLLKIKKILKFSLILMPPMRSSKLEMKLHMVAKTTSLLYQEVIIRKSRDFHGFKSEKYFVHYFCDSTKVTLFNLFILKVLCFLKSFGWPRMKNNLLRDQYPHPFYQDCVKKTFFIFQITFVQDSQMIILTQVLNIVT